jgi:hypothetical protein
LLVVPQSAEIYQFTTWRLTFIRFGILVIFLLSRWQQNLRGGRRLTRWIITRCKSITFDPIPGPANAPIHFRGPVSKRGALTHHPFFAGVAFNAKIWTNSAKQSDTEATLIDGVVVVSQSVAIKAPFFQIIGHSVEENNAHERRSPERKDLRKWSTKRENKALAYGTLDVPMSNLNGRRNLECKSKALFNIRGPVKIRFWYLTGAPNI